MIPLISSHYNTKPHTREPLQALVFVNNSVLGLTEVSLDQDDPICLEKLADIRQSRFDYNMDFYLCVVRENEHIFLFEGSKFMEAFLRKKKALLNPLTKQPIESFEVLKSTKLSPNFQHFMMQEDVQVYPRYLPILWNDPTRSQEQVGEYYFGMGNCYYKGRVVEKDIEQALGFYKKAVIKGSEKAVMSLYVIAKDLKKQDLEEALLFLENLKFHIAGIYLTNAKICYRIDLFDKEIAYTRKQAFLGDYSAIVRLIDIYELSTVRDTEQAKLWRSVLPEEWQASKMSLFRKHLEAINYPWNHTQKLDFPEELLKEKAEMEQKNFLETKEKIFSKKV